VLLLLASLLAVHSVVITEVMANPAGASGAHGPEDRNEFVELYNDSSSAVDLLDWILDDGDSPDRLTAWTDSSILEQNPTLLIDTTWLNPGRYAIILDSEYLHPDPIGGHVQPYRLGDSVLVLTTRNTTLGNGLGTTDPLFLVSPYGDSAGSLFDTVSTFGTPMDSADSLPCDAGDGVSWERVNFEQADESGNWLRAVDSAGCTPGLPNSVCSLVDLAVGSLVVGAGSRLVPGEHVLCSAAVANRGTAVVEVWQLRVWLDVNGNGLLDGSELVALLPGLPVEPGCSVWRVCGFSCPEAATDLWAVVEGAVVGGAVDEYPGNDAARVAVSPGAGRLLCLGLSRFSPNGDGFEDSLPVSYELPVAEGQLSVSVLDLAGRVIRILDSRFAISDLRFGRGGIGQMGQTGRIAWDGRDGGGALVPGGFYAVRLELRSAVRTYVDKRPVVVVR
jgi:hypothetical protein